jgi:formate hydrogenlyase subunit 3/multisubunit Na+/H+ antiporter MnhD subunit
MRGSHRQGHVLRRDCGARIFTRQRPPANPRGGDSLKPVSDPILLFLAADAVALMLLGTFAVVLPVSASSFLATMLSGLGTLLCLPPLLMRSPATGFELPVGPPGLSLHFALDPLAVFFLVVVFIAGTAIAAFQETTVKLPRTAAPTHNNIVPQTSFCLAGTVVSLLAADGVTLAIGLAVTSLAIQLPVPGHRHAVLPSPLLLAPLLVLAAVCLLTPPGFAPSFDAIRAAPVDPDRATAAAVLTLAAFATLVWSQSHGDAGSSDGAAAGSQNHATAASQNRASARGWTRNTLTAGVLIPFACYLLLRLVADLAGAASQTGCGFVLLLAGGAVAVTEAWCAARHPDIDGSVSALMRRQAGLAMAGTGLALIARAADLPAASSFALAATSLAAIGVGLPGVLASLAIHAIGESAGTWRLSRLGGLVHAMPATSAALAAGLLGLSAVPPGLGFASLWLLFQSILSAPRTGGLLFQLPLALIGAALALSAALATAASVRLIGIAVLGRPRTPQGAGALEGKWPFRTVLMVLTGLSLIACILPGAALWLLADPAIHALNAAPPGVRVGLRLLIPSIASPSYLALPVCALLALATGAVLLAPRWLRKEAKTAGLWANGMAPPVGLPFGDPAGQSTGEGFVPKLPTLPAPRMSRLLLSSLRLARLPALPMLRPPSPAVGLWLVLAAFGVLLLALAVSG